MKRSNELKNIWIVSNPQDLSDHSIYSPIGHQWKEFPGLKVKDWDWEGKHVVNWEKFVKFVTANRADEHGTPLPLGLQNPVKPGFPVRGYPLQGVPPWGYPFLQGVPPQVVFYGFFFTFRAQFSLIFSRNIITILFLMLLIHTNVNFASDWLFRIKLIFQPKMGQFQK